MTSQERESTLVILSLLWIYIKTKKVTQVKLSLS